MKESDQEDAQRIRKNMDITGRFLIFEVLVSIVIAIGIWYFIRT